MPASNSSHSAVRWAARLTGAGTLGLLLLFVVAHVFENPPGPRPTSSEWLGLMFFPTGVIVGLIVAFFRERLGALIAISSLAVFYLWHLAGRGEFPSGPYFFLFTSPAFLFLASGLLEKASTATGIDANHREPGPPESAP